MSGTDDTERRRWLTTGGARELAFFVVSMS
jgi:hypothetical protein